MALTPTPDDLLARARSDLRIGLPIVLSGPDGSVLALAAETTTPERLADLKAIGQPVLAITSRRADTLKARAYDGDVARLILPHDSDVAWIRAATDPSAPLDRPLMGPYTTARGGSADLHRLAIRLTKSARLLPDALIVDVSDPDPALTRLDAAEATRRLDSPVAITEVVSGRVPTQFAGQGRVRVFREADGAEEHYAVEVGTPTLADNVLVRLHSACFTGDVLGSLKCDCGPQLHAAMRTMAADGAGLLLYMNQEGRGIGLANKMRAYSLQDQGFDTVEANHRLGFEDDERDFRTGAAMLRHLGITRVRLLTNNPAKVAMLEASGLTVTARVPLAVGRTPENTEYLDIKAKKSGHIL
ncbi:MAG: GTP cyclohydrolase II [Pseudomonadota bacterium]